MFIKTDIKINSKNKNTRIASIIAKGAESILSEYVKTASDKTRFQYKGEILRDNQGEVKLSAEIAKHPDALWIRAKAIECDQENDNGDYFSREEIIKSYKTFEGVPIFTNHENSQVENAKGKIVLAEWDEKTGSVYCTGFIDRKAYPDLCRAIEEGYVTDVSMGTQVDFSTCSICNQKANTADQYCTHVKTMKGRMIDGKKVFEKNYGLKFIELSVVTDGACKDCTIREIIDPEDVIGKSENILKAASGNLKKLISTGIIIKEAGQEEIQKLNDAMDLITQVSQKMLDQRQFIDLEFLQKVTEVLAELQHVTDELVDQGYGSVGDSKQQATQPQKMDIPPVSKQQYPEAPTPVMEDSGEGGVGTVTEPMPTPTPTTSSDTASWNKFSRNLKDLSETAKNISNVITGQQYIGGKENVKTENINQDTVKKLAKVWENPSVKKYTLEAADGNFKVVIGSDEVIGILGTEKVASFKIADLDADIKENLRNNPKEVASYMLDALKTKVAEKAPTNTKEQQEQTLENQLESQNPPLHPREKESKQSITEDQLEQKRHGEVEVNHKVQEKQLDKVPDTQFARQGETSKNFEVQELQLKDKSIKGNSAPSGENRAKGVENQTEALVEKQLDQSRGGDTPAREEITEKQLEKQSPLWGRRISSKEDAKFAVSATIKAMARTAMATGATPDEVIKIATDITESPTKMVETNKEIERLAGNGDERWRMLRRASFHGQNLRTSSNDVKDYLLGSMSDQGFSGEVSSVVLSAVSRKDNTSKLISEAIKEETKEQETKTTEASVQDFLKEALNDNQQEETVRLDIPSSEIVADKKDEEAFANASFEIATKIAATHGIKVSKNVSVRNSGDIVQVVVTGVQMTEEEHKVAKLNSEKELQLRKEARKRVEAQVPAGGGMPGAPAGGPMGGGGTTMPTPPPGDPTAGSMPPVGTLTTEESPPQDMVEEKSEQENGEALPPGSICPLCGSDDVELSGGELSCNNCGMKGDISVNINVWKVPGTIKEKEPGKKEEGELESEVPEEIGEAPGLEMPSVGVAASFKVTPEMVKVSKNKPIGSVCPSCGSTDVKLETRLGTSRGNCKKCGSSHRVDTFVDKKSKMLLARVEWKDIGVEKIASTSLKEMSAVNTKLHKLSKALEFKGMKNQFESGDIKVKAEIINSLLEKGLI